MRKKEVEEWFDNATEDIIEVTWRTFVDESAIGDPYAATGLFSFRWNDIHGIVMKTLFRFLCKGPARTFKRAVIIPY